jgi:hypothetical protein
MAICPLRVLFCSLAAAFAARLAAQTTVSVPCNLDNTLYEDPTGSLSNGAGTSLFVGRPNGGTIRRALLRFDIAGTIPAGAHVLSASLSFNVVNSPVATPLDVRGHLVLQAWGEGSSSGAGGGGGGAPAQPGDATWLHTFYPNSFWSTPGGDFIATPSFTMATPAVGIATAPVATQATADVQTWLDHPNVNFGWLLKMVDEVASSTARRIDSRESTGTTPTLSVTYVTAGHTGVWGNGCAVGAGTFTFAWSGVLSGGSPIQLVLGNGPANQIGADFFSFGLDPVGTPLAPSCNLYLPFAAGIITGSMFTLSGAGAAATSLTVPAGFPGFLVVSQSAALDTSPVGFVLSNAGFIDLP